MSERFVRIYKKYYVDELKSHLLIYGALAGSCASCKCMDIKLDALKCPECGNEFKFIAFMSPREHMPKMLKISHERPNITFVDYDDFKRMEGEEKAKGILG